MDCIFKSALRVIIVMFVALFTTTASNAAFPIEASNSSTVKQVQKIRTGEKTRAPAGLQIFCILNDNHCRHGGSAQIKMSRKLMSALKRVNAKVNRTIRPKSDRGDIWSVNVRSGDCEDYVLTKRAELISIGFPPSALRIATAYTRSGEGHAVLVVRSDQGDFVLDNRRRSIREWHKAGLNWIAISSPNPTRWATIKN